MHTNFILCTFLLLGVQLGAALRYPTYLQGFHNEDCVGTSTLFLNTNINVTAEFPNVQHKSISLQGLWRYEQRGDLNITTISRSQNGEAKCDSGVIGGQVVDLVEVVKLANGDLDDSVLTLYPLFYWYGEPVVVDEQGVSKIDNLTVTSYVFTGPLSFSIFDGENYTGNATCLQAEGASRNDGFGVNERRDLGIELSVKSAKLGCDGNEGRAINSIAEGTRIIWVSE